MLNDNPALYYRLIKYFLSLNLGSVTLTLTFLDKYERLWWIESPSKYDPISFAPIFKTVPTICHVFLIMRKVQTMQIA